MHTNLISSPAQSYCFYVHARLKCINSMGFTVYITRVLYPNSVLASYPAPNVGNDDYHLKYNITHRGSGNEVVGNGS